MILLIAGNMGSGKTTFRKELCKKLKLSYHLIGGENKNGSDVTRLRTKAALIEDIKTYIRFNDVVIIETIRFNKSWISWLTQFKKGHKIVVVDFNISYDENKKRILEREGKIKKTRLKVFHKYWWSNFYAFPFYSKLGDEIIEVSDKTDTKKILRRLYAYLYSIQRPS